MQKRVKLMGVGAILLMGALFASDRLMAQDQLPEEGGCSVESGVCGVVTLPEICIDYPPELGGRICNPAVDLDVPGKKVP